MPRRAWEPAWVDPQTKYRYYLPEQLVALDIITLCIKLGIPLKNLKKHIAPDGTLDKKSLLELGKQVMEEKIAGMQLGVEITELNLRSMEENQEYCGRQGVYTREIQERFLLEVPFCGNWNDLIQKERMAIDLFQSAQEQGMAPVFPAGMILRCDTEPISFSFFVQVLHPREQDERILRIPKSTFACCQIAITPQTDILHVLAQNFAMRDLRTVVISNMILNNLHFNSRYSEIQIPI